MCIRDRTIDGARDPTGDDDFGRYQIVRPIGEGGMGTVYLAEQRDPIRRLVALKVVKLGMDTSQVLARFDNERQALAMMDHPNIAQPVLSWRLALGLCARRGFHCRAPVCGSGGRVSENARSSRYCGARSHWRAGAPAAR